MLGGNHLGAALSFSQHPLKGSDQALNLAEQQEDAQEHICHRSFITFTHATKSPNASPDTLPPASPPALHRWCQHIHTAQESSI